MINPHDDAQLYSGFLGPAEAAATFDVLLATVEWHDTVTNPEGAKIKLKRKMAYASDKLVEYNYNKLMLPGMLWTPQLTELRQIIENRTSLKFNSVLLNLYEDGHDQIRWHADKEKQLGPRPVIACLNLGSTRRFHFKRISDGFTTHCDLAAGDLLIMREDCQRNWLHAILPEKEVKTPRISLTYRWVYEQESGDKP